MRQFAADAGKKLIALAVLLLAAWLLFKVVLGVVMGLVWIVVVVVAVIAVIWAIRVL